MKLFKLFSVAVALLCAVPCFGKPIDLHGQWWHQKKSISMDLPMDASIEEGSKELTLNFHEDVGEVYVTVTSSTGVVIYDKKIETSNLSSLVIPLIDGSMGLLQITDGINLISGSF